MPYKTETVEPAVVLTHKGITVYQCYFDDNYDTPDTFTFTTNKTNTNADDVDAFGVLALEVPSAKRIKTDAPSAFVPTTPGITPDLLTSDPGYATHVQLVVKWFETDKPALIRAAIIEAIEAGLIK